MHRYNQGYADIALSNNVISLFQNVFNYQNNEIVLYKSCEHQHLIYLVGTPMVRLIHFQFRKMKEPFNS